MISLAGRDILHAWSKYVFTGVGLGLLIGVTVPVPPSVQVGREVEPGQPFEA